MSTEGYELVDYKYEAGIDITKELNALHDNEEKFLAIPIKYEGKNIILKGIEYDNKLYKIYDKHKNEITNELKNGIVISKSFSVIYGKVKGDYISLTINNKEEQFEIIDVSKEYGQAQVYFERSTLSKLYSKGENSDLYTGIYSDKPIDEDNYSYVIEKQQILEQSKSVQGFMYLSIGFMLIVSILIAVIVLFILTSLTVEDNFYNISLLKVMGYSKKEVNSMIINSYLSYSIIAFIISLPMTIISMKYFTNDIGKKFDIVLPFIFEPWQGIVGLLIIILIFEIGTINSKSKINKISLQEVLKQYSE
jgi:putative ABC transport system permease protein